MCAFQFVPDSTSPVRVPAGETSAPITFAEIAGGTPRMMFIRITRLGLEDGAPTDGPNPGFILQAAGGDSPAGPETTVPLQFSPSATVGIVNGAGTKVAEAGFRTDSFDVYCIGISVRRPGSRWSLRIVNNDDDPRRFVCVVADNDDANGSGARQPWINLSAAVTFTPGSHSSGARAVNFGTGPLIVAPQTMPDPYRLTVPEPIPPNLADQVGITYQSDRPGERSQTYAVVSNDSSAHQSELHNNVIGISLREGSDGGGVIDPPPPPLEFGPCRSCHDCSGYSGNGGNCTNCGDPKMSHVVNPF